MNPTPERTQAAIERLRAHIAFVKSRGSRLNQCERDEELVLALLEAAAKALEKANAALLSGDPDGITRGDVTIYRLDGGKVGVALNAVRQALAAYQSDTGGDAILASPGPDQSNEGN